MSLLGSVQRKLQALQKIWQEDARRNNGQKKNKKNKIIIILKWNITSSFGYHLHISDYSQQNGNSTEMEQIVSQTPYLMDVTAEMKHGKPRSVYPTKLSWSLNVQAEIQAV